MLVSRLVHKDGVGTYWEFSLIYFVRLWIYCNSFIDIYICNMVLPRIILSGLAR